MRALRPVTPLHSPDIPAGVHPDRDRGHPKIKTAADGVLLEPRRVTKCFGRSLGARTACAPGPIHQEPAHVPCPVLEFEIPSANRPRFSLRLSLPGDNATPKPSACQAQPFSQRPRGADAFTATSSSDQGRS